MKQKNPKLVFIQSVAQQARRFDSEISTEAKSVIKSLQQRPKTYYTIKDVEDVVETLKSKMILINKEAHTEFSKKGIKGLDGTDISSIDLETSYISNDEFEEIKKENESLKTKLLEIQPLEKKIEDLEILLDEKDEEINQLKGDTGLSSEKVQNQIKEINKLQEQLKQEKKDREKIEAEFETVGNALMTTRLEIEELQTALANKDIEIENLNSENQILTSHTEENILLKETNTGLSQQLRTTNEKIQQLELKIKIFEEENQSLKMQIDKLGQENEDLLLDSKETTQEAISLQNEIDELKKSLGKQEEENRDLSNRLTKEITSLKQDLSEKSARNQNLNNKILELQEAHEEDLNARRSLETQIEDLKIDLKGKEKRIHSIEADRNELHEKFSSIKIAYETQKSEVNDLKAQLTTKDNEIKQWQKDLEILRERQEAMAKDASDSRDVMVQFEREKDIFETKFRDLNRQLEDSEKICNSYEKRLKETKLELEKNLTEKKSLIEEQKLLVEKTENLTSAVETLRINLAKNPKYAILFVLQDIQKASVGELAKTVAIQLVFAVRLMKELQQEGWVDFDEDTGNVRLIKPLLTTD